MKKKKRYEFSKIMMLILVIFGILNSIVFWIAVMLDKMPDSAVAITWVTEVVAIYAAYIIYQFKQKDSRNKYKIDEDGIPYNLHDTNEEMESEVYEYNEESEIDTDELE